MVLGLLHVDGNNSILIKLVALSVEEFGGEDNIVEDQLESSYSRHIPPIVRLALQISMPVNATKFWIRGTGLGYVPVIISASAFHFNHHRDQ